MKWKCPWKRSCKGCVAQLPSLRAALSFLGLLQFVARALWQLQEALKLRKFCGLTLLKPLNNFYKPFFSPCCHEEENPVGDELLPSAADDGSFGSCCGVLMKGGISPEQGVVTKVFGRVL